LLFPYGFDDAMDIPNSSVKAGMVVGVGAGGAGYVLSLLDPESMVGATEAQVAAVVPTQWKAGLATRRRPPQSTGAAGAAGTPDRAMSITLNGGSGMRVWADLTPQEQCVLFAAAESSLLYELLRIWRPGLDWGEESPVPYIPELAAAISSLANAGLINAYLDDSDIPLPTEQVSEAIADPNTWGIDYEQRHQVELTPTAAGGEVLSTASNVYSFRSST
jgi:hypothetical protein